MRAEVGGGGRATVLRPRMIARSLLSAVSFAALAAWDPVLAEDKPVGLPEVKVIANTPLAPASPRPAARPAERVPPRAAETPPPRAAETSSRRAAVAPSRTVAPSQPAPEAALAPADPSLIERDKIPANVQTLSVGDFDHAKAPDLLDAMSRGLPGLALSDQTVRNRDLLPNRFLSLPQSDRSSHLRSPGLRLRPMPVCARDGSEQHTPRGGARRAVARGLAPVCIAQ